MGLAFALFLLASYVAVFILGVLCERYYFSRGNGNGGGEGGGEEQQRGSMAAL